MGLIRPPSCRVRSLSVFGHTKRKLLIEENTLLIFFVRVCYKFKPIEVTPQSLLPTILKVVLFRTIEVVPSLFQSE